MKIAVIAADGRSGHAFIEAALSHGHVIKAGARNARSVLIKHPNLKAIHCDALDIDDVRELLKGQDAVVCLIGHVKDSPADVQTRAIKNTITVMKELGVRRLVSLTGTGVRLPDDKITLLDRILNVGISLIDPERVEDGIRHAMVIKRSGLRWTILRVLKLQSSSSAAVVLREHGPTQAYVSRQDVAKAILDVLEHDSHIKKMPILGK